MTDYQVSEDINYYFKDILNGRKAVDYDKIDKEGFPINIIITERMVRVKTYGAKSFIFNKFKDESAKTLWIRNTNSVVEKESMNFLSDVSPDLIDVKIRNIQGTPTLFYNKKPFLYMASLTTPTSIRGSRNYCKYVVWDEFNDNMSYVKNKIVRNFHDMLSSTGKLLEPHMKNERKIFILGNNQTLNHPLLVSWGITAIEKEVTKIYDDKGNPFILILFPILSDDEKKQVKEINSNNFEYYSAVLSGVANHIYYNMSNFDELNYVFKYFKPTTERKIKDFLFKNNFWDIGLHLSFTFKVNDDYYNIYDIPTYLRSSLKTIHHVVNLTGLSNELRKEGITMKIDNHIQKDKKNNNIVYTSTPRHQKEGVFLLSSVYINKLQNYLGENKFSFENVSSRQGFLDFIQKK